MLGYITTREKLIVNLWWHTSAPCIQDKYYVDMQHNCVYMHFMARYVSRQHNSSRMLTYMYLAC